MTSKKQNNKRGLNHKPRSSKLSFPKRRIVWFILPGLGLILLIAAQQAASSVLIPTSYPIPSTSLTAIINSGPTPTAMTAGIAAPSFMLTGLDGKPYQLQDFRGKDVILNFWATWCPPCKLEMPLLEAVSEHFKNQNAVVLGVNDKEDSAVITPFVKSLNITFPILLDPTEDVFVKYQIYGLPTTYFIDKQGRLVDESVGPLTASTLTRYLDKLKAVDGT